MTRCPHCDAPRSPHARDCPVRIKQERAAKRARELFFGKER